MLALSFSGSTKQFCSLQEYIRDLEKEEEEQKRIQKVFQYLITSIILTFYSYGVSYDSIQMQEQARRQERKNRDQFRKMLEVHVADGTLTAKTHWRDYCAQVLEILFFVIR